MFYFLKNFKVFFKTIFRVFIEESLKLFLEPFLESLLNLLQYCSCFIFVCLFVFWQQGM